MRKIFLALAFIFGVLGIVLLYWLDTITLVPLCISFLFGYLAFVKSEGNQKKLPKILLIAVGITFAVVIAKHFLVKDEVATDVQFEQTKVESEKEAQKTLENDLE